MRPICFGSGAIFKRQLQTFSFGTGSTTARYRFSICRDSNSRPKLCSAPGLFAINSTPLVSASNRWTWRRYFRFRARAQKSRASIEEAIANGRFRLVLSQLYGTSIQPAGLSMAITARSSYKIGMCVPSESSMFCGLGTGKRLLKREQQRSSLPIPATPPSRTA